MVKVLHVFGVLDRGGAELRTIEVVEQLDPRRFRCDFVALSEQRGSLEARITRAGSRVFHRGLTWSFPWRFTTLVKNYDVLHSHVHHFSGVLVFLARVAGVRNRIVHLRSMDDQHSSAGPLRQLQRRLLRMLVDSSATHILAVSEGVMSAAWSIDWRRDARCRVVCNGVSPQRLTADVTARAPKVTAVCVGSVKAGKNQLRLLDIFEACRLRRGDLHLVIVGRDVDEYGRRVRDAIATRGLSGSVTMTGEVAEPLDEVRRAHVMVFPSKSEGLPGAVLEAAAVGVPVVASDLPGVREIARHFPYVSTVSLDSTDTEWADAVMAALEVAEHWRGRSGEMLEQSPFSLSAAVESCQRLWSGSNAQLA